MADRGSYIPSIWSSGELIAAEKLNRLERALAATDKDALQALSTLMVAQQASQQGIADLTSRVDELDQRTDDAALINTITTSIEYINDLAATLSAAVSQAENSLSTTIAIVQQQQQTLNNNYAIVSALVNWLSSSSNTLTIGTSPYKIVLGPEHLQFLYNDQEIGRFTQSIFYDKNTNISKTLTLGDFIITITENNKALVWT